MDVFKSLANAAGKGNELAQLLKSFYQAHSTNRLPTLEPFLPLLFRHNGKAVTLNDYFPMEILFDVNSPPDLTLMCSRQVGKTFTMGLRTSINSAFVPFWRPLVVAPFFETIRRISSEYYQSLMDQSPCKSLFYGEGCTRQVLERSLPNQSKIRFTYAHRSGDRARGIPATENIFDEFQLMYPEVMTVILATMNASPYGNIVTCAGTPITNANMLSRRYTEKSTQSHWATKCGACGYTNIAAMEFDLLQMIGPLRPDISKDRPAVICAKCRQPLHTWTGQWYHINPSKRDSHLGIHVPCIILPEHCTNYDKWRTIIQMLEDRSVADYVKYNEILGVPFDDGVALLSVSDIRRRAILGDNHVPTAARNLSQYRGRIAIGIDWGGRGMGGASYTKVCVAAMRSDSTIDVLFGATLPKDATSHDEAALINYLFKVFKPQFVAHDNIGIGARAEEMLIGSGIPASVMMPMEYVGEMQNAIVRRRRVPDTSKTVFSVDKTRGLLRLVECYKADKIFTFNLSERFGTENLLLDFTHIRAELRVLAHALRAETMLIQAEPNQSDDFVHAVHHAANALWFNYGWPNLAEKLIITTPQELSTYIVELQRALDPATVEALGLTDLQIAT